MALVAIAIPAMAQSDWLAKPLHIVAPLAAVSFIDRSNCWGRAAGATTPAAFSARLQVDLVQAATIPKLQETLADHGSHRVALASAEQAGKVEHEIRVSTDVIAGTGIKLE